MNLLYVAALYFSALRAYSEHGYREALENILDDFIMGAFCLAKRCKCKSYMSIGKHGVKVDGILGCIQLTCCVGRD